ncbi:MAG: NAD(+) synthase, partial [Lactobacillus iners]|nr:NAD(+) synthase [Lactobacillus iners]MCT7808625.1 NAD(+) synthase [Lactobacillus iners]
QKAPTADLEEKRPALPDEQALGVSYDKIDDYLEGKELAKVDAERIEYLWTRSEHKRHLPITIFDDFYKKNN